VAGVRNDRGNAWLRADHLFNPLPIANRSLSVSHDDVGIGPEDLLLQGNLKSSHYRHHDGNRNYPDCYPED
jgi:hypothetical protein